MPTLDGFPIFKPPFGRITALDMNRGEHLWTVANSDGPRDHALVAELDLPSLGVAGRPAPLVTMFRAYDKATGEVVWEIELPAGTTGAPMTYYMRESNSWL